MKEEVDVEGIVYRCKVCGKEWDDDGCRVSVVSGLSYEVEEFVCEGCKGQEATRQ